MAIDKFEDLPGIISEIQDGGLQIFEENANPSVLIIGTAAKGLADTPVQVQRAQEIETQFGKEGTLVRGMYEALSGGAANAYVMRIGAESAILYGVGTDDQVANPTSIETLVKDKDAADLYLVRYIKPSDIGPNAIEGRLIIKNVLGEVVFDNNPGGQAIDSGEVIVAGDFTGGVSIGSLLDEEDYVSMRDIAQDEVAVLAEAVGTMAAAGPEAFDLANAETKLGSYIVYVDGEELAESEFSVAAGAGTNGVDQITVDLSGNLLGGEAITVDYIFDNDVAHNLRDGRDGTEMSRMELYEAIEQGYRQIENDEFKIIFVVDTYLDDKNSVDGDLIILSSDESVPVGRRYPVAGAKGDALGRVWKEEYEGEFFYFWDIDGDGQAEIFPLVGSASATTRIDGVPFEDGNFKEVNFGYQLANFCFESSSNEYNVTGVVGVKMPKSFSAKDISLWVGKEPVVDYDGKVIQNGSGLSGLKLLAGKTNYASGLWATEDGFMPGAAGEKAGQVLEDLGGRAIDIGRYLSVFVGVQTFFNNIDETGYGYHANGAGYYAGYYSTLPVQSAPTNKVAENAAQPFKLSKTKLNSLAKFSMIAYKEKNGVLRFSDAPTAARKSSDFRRLTTIRVINEVVDAVRDIAEPYIGEPNTASSRQSLQSNINLELGKMQELGVVQRFEAKVSATTKQQIEGDATVELIIVPPFELRKIRVVTSLAKQ